MKLCSNQIQKFSDDCKPAPISFYLEDGNLVFPKYPLTPRSTPTLVYLWLKTQNNIEKTVEISYDSCSPAKADQRTKILLPLYDAAGLNAKKHVSSTMKGWL